MTHIRLKLTIAAVVLLSALTYLGFAGISSGWVYYVEVDQFLANPDYHDDRVRLSGKVGDEVFESHPARLEAKFQILGEENDMRVVYSGVVPSMFKVGTEVVVEGKLDEAGVFQANTMLTKCASKYQAEEHAERMANVGDPGLAPMPPNHPETAK